MSKRYIIILALVLGFTCISLASFFIFYVLPSAQQPAPVTGEVTGQAAPGVESVIINGENIPLEPDLRFRATVALKEGQKQLVIETQYRGRRFSKQYLVTPQPGAQKTFKLLIPGQEYRQIVSESGDAKIADVIVKTVPTEELQALINKQAKAVLEKEVVHMINRDVPAGTGYAIVAKEIRKIVRSEAPEIIEQEVKKAIVDRLSTQEVFGLAEEQLGGVLLLKLKQVIDNKGLWKMIQDTVKHEVLLTIDKDALLAIAKQSIEKESKKAVNKKVLQQYAEATVRKEVVSIIRDMVSREAFSLTGLELKKLFDEKYAEEIRTKGPKPPLKILSNFTTPDILSVVGKPPYDLILELEPGMILLVKREKDKYFGYVYLTGSQQWFALQEISYQKFKDLLESGKLP
ncbi:MAG: hypothetical protein PHH60_05165 [Candidatus Margulisbacteria bacterium]|nr:hypothetical protein [Candidatus Margulisiibacteriota bacterium]